MKCVASLLPYNAKYMGFPVRQDYYLQKLVYKKLARVGNRVSKIVTRM